MPELSEGEIRGTIQSFQNEMEALVSKVNELESERMEHELVIGAIQPLDKDRKCFRLIGGVLVERNVAEVLPAVQQNQAGIAQVIKQLEMQLQKKKEELQKFADDNGVRLNMAGGGGGEGSSSAGDKPSSSQGVLV
mmetsp:Transcript_17880/g.58461  ORF Transcript_17880/g.58461 Transcript_17880/m.58461 type:complete len:136 (-) Transcript_17880:68-475(-)